MNRKHVIIFLFIVHSIGATTYGQNLYDYYLVRGSSKISDMDYEGAHFYLTKAVERYPDSADAWFNRGGANYFLLEMEAAKRDFNRTFELDPNNTEVYKWRGMIYHQLLDYDMAEKDYQAYLSKIDEVFVQLKLAEVYILQHNYKEAGIVLSMLENRCVKNPNYYNVQGMLHEETKMAEKAYSSYSTAITLDPKQATFYMNRARLLHSLERKEEACLDWTSATNLGLESAIPLMMTAGCE